MREPGLIRTVDELKRVVDRRLVDVRADLVGFRERRENLDIEYARGQEHELATMQDLLCIILGQPRTHYASTR